MRTLTCYDQTLAAYRVVWPNRLSWTRRLYTLDSWEATVPDDAVDDLRDAYVIGVQGLDLALKLHGFDQDAHAKTADVSGSCVGWWFDRTVVVPPDGSSYDDRSGPAESRMRGFVNDQAGPGAAADRQWPLLALAGSDSGAGADGRSRLRYRNLAEELEAIGEQGGVGWQMRLDRDAGAVLFEPLPVADLTADVVVTVDSTDKLTRSLRRQQNTSYVYVGGQGEGADRTIVERFRQGAGSRPDRLEGWRDARDTNEADDLETRGDEVLADERPVESIRGRLRQFGAYQVGVEFDLGDEIRLKHAPWGLDGGFVVEAVETTVDKAGERSVVEVGGERPSFRRQVMRSGGQRREPTVDKGDYADAGHDHDGRYVNEAGDTMSGNLVVDDNNIIAKNSAGGGQLVIDPVGVSDGRFRIDGFTEDGTLRARLEYRPGIGFDFFAYDSSQTLQSELRIRDGGTHVFEKGNVTVKEDFTVNGSKNAEIDPEDPDNPNLRYRFAAVEADEPGLLIHRRTVTIPEGNGGEATVDLPSHWSRIARDGDAMVTPLNDTRDQAPAAAAVDLTVPEVTVRGKPGDYRVWVMAARADRGVDGWTHEVEVSPDDDEEGL